MTPDREHSIASAEAASITGCLEDRRLPAKPSILLPNLGITGTPDNAPRNSNSPVQA
jgi:hypothetical protein